MILRAAAVLGTLLVTACAPGPAPRPIPTTCLFIVVRADSIFVFQSPCPSMVPSRPIPPHLLHRTAA